MLLTPPPLDNPHSPQGHASAVYRDRGVVDTAGCREGNHLANKHEDASHARQPKMARVVVEECKVEGNLLTHILANVFQGLWLENTHLCPLVRQKLPVGKMSRELVNNFLFQRSQLLPLRHDLRLEALAEEVFHDLVVRQTAKDAPFTPVVLVSVDLLEGRVVRPIASTICPLDWESKLQLVSCELEIGMSLVRSRDDQADLISLREFFVEQTVRISQSSQERVVVWKLRAGFKNQDSGRVGPLTLMLNVLGGLLVE
mmetsp:Transcript_84/g.255  ORF Transcript_84/g.255 Transcript_84/m.255 type:complete len:257 (-) Transcript_84:45-815(-)